MKVGIILIFYALNNLVKSGFDCHQQFGYEGDNLLQSFFVQSVKDILSLSDKF